MRVVLIEGFLAVRAGGRRVSYTRPAAPGGGSQAPDGQGADTNAVGDWQRVVVTFRDTPLSAASGQFNRHAAILLVVNDPRIAVYRVSGSFHTDDAARFVRTVAALRPVRVIAVGSERVEIVHAK